MSACTLCLNMIVRDEEGILARALSSVADHISYWVICDTGSTDGTRELVRSIFAARNIPGELHSFEFENFAQARNAALERARGSDGQFDYLLLMDADMELVVEDAAFRRHLTASSYQVLQKAGMSYWNTRLLRRDIPARYRGVTHEYLERTEGRAALDSIRFIDHADGANRRFKLERDIRLLREGLADEPHNARYMFYLAQTYRDAGRWHEAAEVYAARVNMGGWDEEVWNAQLQEARCRLRLGDQPGFLTTALKAYNRRPHRAEPLYELARFFRLRELHDMAMTFCEKAADLPWPKNDRLFIEDWVYATGIREETSISGFYCESDERQEAGRRCCYELALDRSVKESTRRRARRNQTFYARPAASLFPSFRSWPLPSDLASTGFFTNPSVANWNGTTYVIMKNVNYQVSDGYYITTDGAPITGRNFLLRLDSELKPDTWSEIRAPVDLPSPSYPLVRGFEDARLFAWDDSLWCSSTIRELDQQGWCEVVLAKIENPLEPSCQLSQWRVLEPEGPRAHQKNWMPLVTNGTLQFIYSVDPTRIVDDCGRTIHATTPLPAFDYLRGGSQAVPFDDGYLVITHEVSEWDQHRDYLHRLIWFDESMVVKSYTMPFYLMKKGIEFVAGLAWHSDSRHLIVSFGLNDAEARIATVLADDVRARLVECSST